MQDQYIRQVIREILQEDVSDILSLENRTVLPKGELKTLLIISPGVNNAYGWTYAAPRHAQFAIDAGLPDRGVGVVVAPNSSTPIDDVIKEIGKSKNLKIDLLLSARTRILLGFSGGGGNVINYMASGSPLLSTISKIYLADPVAPADYADLIPKMGSNISKVTMTYNPENWGGTPFLNSVKRGLPIFAKKLNAAAGSEVAKLVERKHPDQLKDMLASI